MRFIQNKAFPVIITNVSGKIISLNKQALMNIRKIEVVGYIFDLLDKDKIFKMSMYPRGIEIIKTTSKEYPLSYSKIQCKDYDKNIENCLTENTFSNSQELENVRRILDLYNRSKSPARRITVFEYLSYILSKMDDKNAVKKINPTILNKGNFYNNISLSQLELLFISMIALLSEINGLTEVKVLVTDQGEIEFVFSKAPLLMIDSEFRFVKACPKLVPNLILIQSICEEENIAVKTTKLTNDIRVSYKIPKTSKGKLFVGAPAISQEQRILEIIDAFMK